MVAPSGVSAAPSLDPTWTKGDQFTSIISGGWDAEVHVTRPGQTKDLAIPKRQKIRDGYRAEWVLIGTKGKNAKIVPFRRAYWPVP